MEDLPDMADVALICEVDVSMSSQFLYKNTSAVQFKPVWIFTKIQVCFIRQILQFSVLQ